MLETRLITKRSENSKEEWKTGYFLSTDELEELIKDYQFQENDKLVHNAKTFIENWIKINKI